MLPSPVIFIPGIQGSELRDEYPVDPETVWSVWNAIKKDFKRITLHPYDKRYESIEPARVKHDQIFGLFYNELIEELRYNLSPSQDEPVPVYPFAYDWRQPLAYTQVQLALFIEEVIERTSLMKHYNQDGYNQDTGKVHLVGHSMGGLIIAGLMANQIPIIPDLSKKVDKIATIASPFRGSMESIAKTTIGQSSLFSSGSRERETARVTPALYHLLPSYPDVITNLTTENFLFSHENWQKSILHTLEAFIHRHQLPKTEGPSAESLLQEMLTEAFEHRQSIEKDVSSNLTSTTQWLSIAGVGCETRVFMSVDQENGNRFLLDEPTGQFKRSRSNSPEATGDGTVPWYGAQCGFLKKEQIICLTPNDYSFWELKDKALNAVSFHANLPNMNLAQRLVITHLLGKKHGDLGGSPGPGISPKNWTPPINKDWLR